MSHSRFVIAAGTVAACIGGASTPALASPLNYLLQIRSVTATAYDNSANASDFVSFTASDFGPFSAVANASAGAGRSNAGQTSTLNPDTGISVSHGAHAFGSKLNQAGGNGTSSFFTQFEVLEPVMAVVSFSSVGDFTAVFLLSGPTFEIGPTTEAFEPMSVLLTPGTYSMTAEAMYGAGAPRFGGGSAQASVAVPSVGAFPVLIGGVIACGRRRRNG